MDPADRELLLSQLADGELNADEACHVLLDVLDDAPQRQQLKAMLLMRRSLAAWRNQQPASMVLTLPEASPRPSSHHAAWRTVSLAAAALLGGVLVAGGFLLGQRDPAAPAGARIAAEAPPVHQPPAPRSSVIVTAADRRDVASAFALHESVAGPIRWYASDDTHVQVDPVRATSHVGTIDAVGGATGRPIGILLRVMPQSGGPSKNYTIVCRDGVASTIELPPPVPGQTVRLRLLPAIVNGEIKIQYAIAATKTNGRLIEAALAGQRSVGLEQTSLGQLALGNQLVDVDASAWPLGDQRVP